MAKLKAFVPKLEDIADEAIRELYVEDTAPDGTKRFKLDAEGLEDVAGLKSTVNALRSENRKLKDRVKPLEDLGEDDDLEQIITAGRAELERTKSGKERDDVASVRTQMQTQHQKEIEKLNKRLNGQLQTLREVLIANEVRALAADPEIKGNATLLLPHVERQADVFEEEGDDGSVHYVARVLGPDKKVRVDKDGNPLSIKGLLAEFREKTEYSGAFEGSGASGSGAPPDGGSGMPTPPSRTRAPANPQADAMARKRSRQDYGAI
ncbi:MAG TPA: hypothetical protein VFZ21_28985 [Gemmatimonadaceae bacterium]|nr:hypothetical protein [Gemmatimonadaceae bacterium]